MLLAFVVIVGWETLSSAHATTYTEADQLSNVYWIARSLLRLKDQPSRT